MPISQTSPLGRTIAATLPKDDPLLTREEGEALEQAKRELTEERRKVAQSAEPNVAAHMPLRSLSEILAYAQKVVTDNSATPNANIAILARELISAHRKINELTAVLGGVDTALLKTRGDIRRLIGNT